MSHQVAVTERVTLRLPAGSTRTGTPRRWPGWIADRHGDGFEIVSIDPAGGTAYARRHVAITEVSAAGTAHDHLVRVLTVLPRQ